MAQPNPTLLGPCVVTMLLVAHPPLDAHANTLKYPLLLVALPVSAQLVAAIATVVAGAAATDTAWPNRYAPDCGPPTAEPRDAPQVAGAALGQA